MKILVLTDKEAATLWMMVNRARKRHDDLYDDVSVNDVEKYVQKELSANNKRKQNFSKMDIDVAVSILSDWADENMTRGGRAITIDRLAQCLARQSRPE